jgi:hypothetical protein
LVECDFDKHSKCNMWWCEIFLLLSHKWYINKVLKMFFLSVDFIFFPLFCSSTKWFI